MNELALFAGGGGGILGGHLLGWRCVCAVEYDHYARSVLMARQNDGCLPPFPIWDDVRTFDGRPWRGRVDVVSGGFPCQDISAAGKGEGIGGSRSGLWSEMARIVGEVQPRYVWVENSPMLIGRGLGLVLSNLAEMGFSARWGVVGAHHAGAPHKRDRIWVLAHTESKCSGTGLRGGEAWKINQPANCGSHVSNTMCKRGETGISESKQRKEGIAGEFDHSSSGRTSRPGWWEFEPNVGRVANGVAARVDRLRCIGNGQVPRVVQRAWDELSEVHK